MSKLVKDRELLFLRAFIILLPFHLGYGFIADYRYIYASDIFLFLLLFLWLFKTQQFQRRKIYFGKSMVPATLMIVWSTISIFFAISQIIGGVAILMLI